MGLDTAEKTAVGVDGKAPVSGPYGEKIDPRDAKHPLSICQLTNGNSESASAAGDTFSMTTSSNQTANPAALEFAAICAANAVANSAALLGVSGLR